MHQRAWRQSETIVVPNARGCLPNRDGLYETVACKHLRNFRYGFCFTCHAEFDSMAPSGVFGEDWN